jgi:hypothetical protein
MKAKDYLEEQNFNYDHFTELTSTGIFPNYNNIIKFAESYHQKQLELTAVEQAKPEKFRCNLRNPNTKSAFNYECDKQCDVCKISKL